MIEFEVENLIFPRLRLVTLWANQGLSLLLYAPERNGTGTVKISSKSSTKPPYNLATIVFPNVVDLIAAYCSSHSTLHFFQVQWPSQFESPDFQYCLCCSSFDRDNRICQQLQHL